MTLNVKEIIDDEYVLFVNAVVTFKNTNLKVKYKKLRQNVF